MSSELLQLLNEFGGQDNVVGDDGVVPATGPSQLADTLSPSRGTTLPVRALLLLLLLRRKLLRSRGRTG